jgi:hypothetical protein
MSKYLVFIILIFTCSVKSEQVSDYYDNNSILLKVEKDYVEKFISDICLDWRGETRTRKISKNVNISFLEDGSRGENYEIFLKSIKDINEALGHEKLIPVALSNPNKIYADDHEIFIYYGSYSRGNMLLRHAGSLSAMTGWWGSWNHWDDKKNIIRSTISIDKGKVDGILLAYCLRRAILIPLGYPGSSKNYPANNLGASGLFNCSRIDAILRNTPTGADDESQLITEYDKAILRFAERYIASNSSRADVRENVQKNWGNFVLDFSNSK